MYFPSAADGKACECSRSLCVFFRSLKQKDADWCNNDGMLLARAKPADLLSYDAWEVVVSRHDIAGIRVAIFSGWQRYRC